MFDLYKFFNNDKTATVVNNKTATTEEVELGVKKNPGGMFFLSKWRITLHAKKNGKEIAEMDMAEDLPRKDEKSDYTPSIWIWMYGPWYKSHNKNHYRGTELPLLKVAADLCAETPGCKGIHAEDIMPREEGFFKSLGFELHPEDMPVGNNYPSSCYFLSVGKRGNLDKAIDSQLKTDLVESKQALQAIESRNENSWENTFNPFSNN